MAQFYLRVATALLATAVLSLLITRLLLDSSVDATNHRLLAGHAVIHAETIAQTPPAERRAAVKRLSKILGYGVQMEPGELAGEVRTQWRAGNLFVVAPVPDTPGQLAFGPIPHGRMGSLPAAVGIATLLSLLAAWLTIRPLSERVNHLEKASTQMCSGDFSTRVTREPSDALDGVGASLNLLADRIGQLLSDERDLLRTVAHEVRAPISRMHFRVEKIHARAEPAARKDATGLVSDLRQVDTLFEELLTYVAFDEFDYERPELQTTTIDVSSAVTRLVDEVTSTADDLTVEVHGDPQAVIIANEKLFDRAVTNLLLNAMAYGGPKITIFLRTFTHECVVDVQDSGPGIPERDRPKVIKPFVRLAKKKTRGTGLGLAIVKRIMTLHQGRLHILDAPSGGASIQLVWQRANAPQRRRWPFGVRTQTA